MYLWTVTQLQNMEHHILKADFLHEKICKKGKILRCLLKLYHKPWDNLTFPQFRLSVVPFVCPQFLSVGSGKVMFVMLVIQNKAKQISIYIETSERNKCKAWTERGLYILYILYFIVIYCKSIKHNVGIKFKYCKCKLCLTQNVKNYVNTETTLVYIDKRLTNDRPDLSSERPPPNDRALTSKKKISLVKSPRLGSTPRLTDWPTVSCKVTLTLTDKCRCSFYCALLTLRVSAPIGGHLQVVL
jgi:hypothetical protein